MFSPNTQWPKMWRSWPTMLLSLRDKENKTEGMGYMYWSWILNSQIVISWIVEAGFTNSNNIVIIKCINGIVQCYGEIPRYIHRILYDIFPKANPLVEAIDTNKAMWTRLRRESLERRLSSTNSLDFFNVRFTSEPSQERLSEESDTDSNQNKNSWTEIRIRCKTM